MLGQSDFVVIAAPHTPETYKLMNRDRLRRMRRTAYLINVGRGVIVDLADLTAALQAGEIAGAGLDVFEIEPLPAGASAVEHGERHHHAALRRRLAARLPERHLADAAGQYPAVSGRRAAAQRRGQAALVLSLGHFLGF